MGTPPVSTWPCGLEKSAGGKAYAAVVDVRDPDAVAVLAAEVLAENGLPVDRWRGVQRPPRPVDGPLRVRPEGPAVAGEHPVNAQLARRTRNGAAREEQLEGSGADDGVEVSGEDQRRPGGVVGVWRGLGAVDSQGVRSL